MEIFPTFSRFLKDSLPKPGFQSVSQDANLFSGNISSHNSDLDGLGERELLKSCLVTACSSKSFAYTKATKTCPM